MFYDTFIFFSYIQWQSKMSVPIPWVVPFESESDPRHGVKTRHIISANDGDVCISVVTAALLRGVDRPYIIDIGVDEGWWSFFSIDVNPSVTIDAFEPNPLSVANLKPYLETTPQIKLHPFAISDKNGTIPFVLGEGQSHSRTSNNELCVPCVKLEDYILDKRVDLIKIDTEGHDLTILSSIYHLLPQINSIIFEFSVYWYGDTRESCITRSVEGLKRLFKDYKYVYVLSRRQMPPRVDQISEDKIEEFVTYLYDAHSQVDLVVTNINIS